MSKVTSHINLTQPELSDKITPEIFANNFGIIDEVISKLDDSAKSLTTTTNGNASAIAAVKKTAEAATVAANNAIAAVATINAYNQNIFINAGYPTDKVVITISANPLIRRVFFSGVILLKFGSPHIGEQLFQVPAVYVPAYGEQFPINGYGGAQGEVFTNPGDTMIRASISRLDGDARFSGWYIY